MLQNTSKTLGFQKIMVYKTPPGGEVNHIWLMAYFPTVCHFKSEQCITRPHNSVVNGPILLKSNFFKVFNIHVSIVHAFQECCSGHNKHDD